MTLITPEMITQADREAAVAYLVMSGKITQRSSKDMLNGKWDDTGYVEAFAAHRMAGKLEAEREIVAIIRDAIGQGYPSPKEKRDQCAHGKFGWEDCIACYDEFLESALARIEAGTDETACGLGPKGESRNSSKPYSK